MEKTHFFKRTGLSMALIVFLAAPALSFAVESEDVTEITAEQAGVTAAEANSAETEAVNAVTASGMLIEIGNTTAENTTIIVRVAENGASEDVTLEITADTKILTNANRSADLSDWIAGDHIRYMAEEGDNSNELIATQIKNLSFNYFHHGRNGWIKAIREDENEMDVEWANQIFTLDAAGARMVAGLINPASLSDFKVGDRIRARVVDDGDGDPATWKAEIVVVLRRGETLFMRVTRWVVPAEITSIPEDTALPYVITAEVLDSKFYEAGDVNNLIGAPGTEFNIQISEKTRLVRRYLGKTVIGEFMEGDHIRVIGRLNDATGNLDANLIKNNSIQRFGVSSRISEVTAVDTDADTLTVAPIGARNPLTGKRFRIANGLAWTLILGDDALIYEQGEKISLSGVEVGDIVRVRGTANRLNKTIATDAISVVTERFSALLE